MKERENNEAVEEIKEAEVTQEVTESAEETEAVEIKETKPAKKGKAVEKKKGFFSRLGSSLKKFWKTMKSELKKVTWNSRKQTFTSTLLVIACMAVFAVVIGLLDVGFSMGLEGLANLF